MHYVMHYVMHCRVHWVVHYLVHHAMHYVMHCVIGQVLDTDPYQRDDRTDHQSLPVESGVKFGVNYWIHMYPFRTMQAEG